MARNDPQFKLRLPIELKERLDFWAKQSARSLNAEIVHRLQETVKRDDIRRGQEEALGITPEQWEEEQRRKEAEWLDDWEAQENARLLEEYEEIRRGLTPQRKTYLEALSNVGKIFTDEDLLELVRMRMQGTL